MNLLLKVSKDKPLDSALTARYNDDRQLVSGKDLPLQDQRISETLILMDPNIKESYSS